MPPLTDFNPGRSGSSSSIFSSPALRNAIQGGTTTPASSVAQETLLSPSITNPGIGATPSNPTVGLPSSSFAAASELLNAPAATPQVQGGQLGSPLGQLLESAVIGPFRKGFGTERTVQQRSLQLLQQSFDSMPVSPDQLDGETVKAMQASAQAQAVQEVKAQNRSAFNASVGHQLISSGIGAAIQLSALNNAVKSQVKEMTLNTERHLRGIEHQTRIETQARNLVGMKENLQTIDSILTQSEPAATGQQQQSFLRNPSGGRRI